MVAGKRVGFTFLDNNDAETILVDIRMPLGTASTATQQTVQVIEQAAMQQSEIKSIAAVVGQRSNVDTGQAEGAATHIGQIFIELQPTESRDRTSQQVTQSIRDAIAGRTNAAEQVVFSEISGGPGGPAISIRIVGNDPDAIEAAAADLKTALGGFAGVVDITDDSNKGLLELRVVPKPTAATLGLTPASIAQQVRGAVFGLDAHVIVDRQEDIDVRVRLSEATRRSVAEVAQLWIVKPDGSQVPLSEIADIQETTTYATISRINRRRAVTVSAYTIPGISPEDVVPALPLDQLRRDYPTLDFEMAGRQENLGEAFATLPFGMLAAAVLIYIILAVLFDSFFQPILVMLVIPFASIGVIWGHLILGYNLTFLSLIGFVALSGIVVNDSLILVQFYNTRRAAGESVHDALVSAGVARLRAILLTTITTVLGLLPLMLETSFQARFLIPMAISIAVGLLSATVMILIVLPCLMLIFEDLTKAAYLVRHGRMKPDLTKPTPEVGSSHATG